MRYRCTKCNETVCLKEHKIPHTNLLEGYEAENLHLVVKEIHVRFNEQ